MTKKWDLYKNEIQDLYVGRSLTLELAMAIMNSRYGFKASKRAYKMKLEEWAVRKYKSRTCRKDSEGTGRKASQMPIQATTNVDISVTDLNFINPSQMPSTVPEEAEAIVQTCRWRSERDTLPSTPNLTFQNQYQQVETNTISPSTISSDREPLVNSSFMFFSALSDAESLCLLKSRPEMAPHALEIVLRTWKFGGIYMAEALYYLCKDVCCHDLLGVNWTRWTRWCHTDESLFDLIDDNIECEYEQIRLIRAILRTDQRFRHDLPRSHVPWALEWRLAIQQTEWALAKKHLMRLEVRELLRKSAFAVVAEILWELNQLETDIWRRGANQASETQCGLRPKFPPYLEHARKQSLEIAEECRDLGLQVKDFRNTFYIA